VLRWAAARQSWCIDAASGSLAEPVQALRFAQGKLRERGSFYSEWLTPRIKKPPLANP
jgi:hypothetical protein